MRNGKLYGYIPLKDDARNVQETMLKIQTGEIKPENRDVKLREARYLDFMARDKSAD